MYVVCGAVCQAVDVLPIWAAECFPVCGVKAVSQPFPGLLLLFCPKGNKYQINLIYTRFYPFSQKSDIMSSTEPAASALVDNPGVEGFDLIFISVF